MKVFLPTLILVFVTSGCDSADVLKQPEISTGTQWTLTSIVTEQDTLRTDTLWRPPRIRFGGIPEGGSYPLSGNGCVRYQGRYALGGGRQITITDLNSTVTDACGAYQQKVDEAFFAGLRAAGSYEMRSLGPREKYETAHLMLLIYFDGGRGVMRFETSKVVL